MHYSYFFASVMEISGSRYLHENLVLLILFKKILLLVFVEYLRSGGRKLTGIKQVGNALKTEQMTESQLKFLSCYSLCITQG